MAFWQREIIRSGISMTLDGTYRLDLPDHGLLGSLLLRITGREITGLGQGGGDWRIVDFLDKIEVRLNGSTVCKSLSGYLCQAFATYDQGVIPPGAWRNYATNMQSEYVLINFGRHLFDPEMVLDLARFKDVELRITNSAEATDFSGLGLTVVAYWLREATTPALGGYMRTEEWRSWATVSDETKYLVLPVEYPIRRVCLQAVPAVDGSYVEKTGMHNLMDDVKLALDTGQILLWDGSIEDLIRDNFLDFGKEYIVTGSHYMTADKGVRVDLGYVLGGAWGAGSQDGAGAATIPTMETGRTSFTQKPETYEADSPIGFIFKGLAPFETALFRFDHDKNPASWLDPRARASVELNIHTREHADAVDGANTVALDRFVRY